MPNSDPWDRFVHPFLTHMSDSYILSKERTTKVLISLSVQMHRLMCTFVVGIWLWQDKIPDTEVLKKAKMQSVHTLLKLAQLRWTGHVTRMPDERLPKKVLYGELQEGKRS